MKREDAQIRALILLGGRERPTLEDLISGIQEAWDEGYAQGDADGYNNGYADADNGAEHREEGE